MFTVGLKCLETDGDLTNIREAKLHMIDLCVRADGRLAGASVGSVQRDSEVNIVLHDTSGDVTENPPHETVLRPRDTILVLAPLERLVVLSAENHPERRESVEEPTELA